MLLLRTRITEWGVCLTETSLGLDEEISKCEAKMDYRDESDSQEELPYEDRIEHPRSGGRNMGKMCQNNRNKRCDEGLRGLVV